MIDPHPYYPIFSYFDVQLGRPDWPSLRILDFGGNSGNVLQDPNCTIRHSCYYCLDVDQDALKEGRRRFPLAHWNFYNRYNFAYNFHGDREAPLPDFKIEFDVALAFSVMTHMFPGEMVETVSRILSRLKRPSGVLAFTFLEPSAASVYLNKRMARGGLSEEGGDSLLRRMSGAPYFTLINDDYLLLETWEEPQLPLARHEHLLTFIEPEALRDIFPGAQLLPPANGEVQSCCIIGLCL